MSLKHGVVPEVLQLKKQILKMFNAEKNIIVGECSNLFTVSLLRFLILILFVILSFRAQSRNIDVRLSLSKSFEDVSKCFDKLNMTKFKMKSDGDSAKNKYDINDPRNPHCPCHKYQKQADDEYAKLQMKEKNKIGYETNENVSSDNSVSKKYQTSFLKFKRKINNKKFVKMKTVFSKEYWRRLLASTDVADCFHW